LAVRPDGGSRAGSPWPPASSKRLDIGGAPRRRELCRLAVASGFIQEAGHWRRAGARDFRGGARRADTLKTVDRPHSREELVRQRAAWRAEGKRVVFTNGCYDLLHPGHIRLLEQARSLGDVLILALNSDASVRRFKGPSRPLLPEAERAELAAALEAVDAVTLFDEDTPRELIAEVLPDVLVKGADWSHFIAGKEEVEAAGGQVLPLPLEPGYSTTNLVELLLARQP